MGKNDFLTPKAIANRIKAKGLNKLRWYCQLCQKSCRDENGFKCHQLSEGHQRQMQVFGENADRVVDGFSEEFESGFMDHLRRAHPSSRVSAKNVYNEFIADRHHVHMNSTKWLTLTEFVKHLGRTGQCKVDETEKGWFISLIKVDPAKALSDAEKLKRERQEEEEEERTQRLLQMQVERARKLARTDGTAGDAAPGNNELQRSAADGPIKLSLAAPSAAAAAAAAIEDKARSRPAPLFGDGRCCRPLKQRAAAAAAAAAAQEAEQGRRADAERPAGEAAASSSSCSKRSRREAGSGGGSSSNRARLDHWLHEGIVVKVMSKALKEQGYYKQKVRCMCWYIVAYPCMLCRRSSAVVHGTSYMDGQWFGRFCKVLHK
ncbi:domain of Kin17 curved DNA-binding protein-domain-containing protein [Scenedesmus sp. NREL 46B-D3]|nr:domain of Kin17 curved DNA-binding protein-domain-containing protein [Scenedesmus sp. NREL 46B-D3]